ncbi:hypothetical protein TKK_0002758 [Trichogramma kaykai]
MREPPVSSIARPGQTEQRPQAHQQLPRDCSHVGWVVKTWRKLSSHSTVGITALEECETRCQAGWCATDHDFPCQENHELVAPTCNREPTKR